MPDLWDKAEAAYKADSGDIWEKAEVEYKKPAYRGMGSARLKDVETPQRTMRAATKADLATQKPIESKKRLSYDTSDPLGYAKALAEQEGGVQGFVRGNVASSVEPGSLLLDLLTGRGFSTGKKVVEQIGRARHLKAGGGTAGARAAGQAAGKKAEKAVAAGGGVLGAGVFGSQAYEKAKQGDIGGAAAAGVAGGLSLLLGGSAAKKLIGGKKGATQKGQVQQGGVGERAGVDAERAQAKAGGGNRVVGSGPLQQGKPQAAPAPEAKVTTGAGKVGAGQAKGPQAQAVRPVQIGPEGPPQYAVVTSNRGVDFDVVKRTPEFVTVRMRGGDQEYSLTPEQFRDKFKPKTASPAKPRFQIIGSDGKVMMETDSLTQRDSAFAQGFKVRDTQKLGADTAASVQTQKATVQSAPPSTPLMSDRPTTPEVSGPFTKSHAPYGTAIDMATDEWYVAGPHNTVVVNRVYSPSTGKGGPFFVEWTGGPYTKIGSMRVGSRHSKEFGSLDEALDYAHKASALAEGEPSKSKVAQVSPSGLSTDGPSGGGKGPIVATPTTVVPVRKTPREPQAQVSNGGKGLTKSVARAPKHEASTPEATGLANQVQVREAEAKILAEIEPTKGKSPEQWQQIGKRAFDEGATDADFEGLADRIANKDVELTGERVGVLLEGKRQLMNRVNQARAALDASPADTNARVAYEAAQARLDDFAMKVQAGKGRWSDVGRALQAGTELDTGDFAQVLTEARRRGSNMSEGRIRELVSQVQERDTRIAQLEKENSSILADRAMQRLSRERRTAQKLGDIQSRRQDALKRLGKTTGQLQAGIDPAQARAFYDWAKTYAEEGITRLDDIVVRAAEELGWKREDVINHLAARISEYKTQSELSKQMRELKGQAGAEARIAELKRQLDTGEFEKPDMKRRAVEGQLANLRAERDYWSSRVREAVKQPETGGKAFARAASSAVRGLVLGSDVGTLTRQGLFTWGRVPLGDTTAPKATVKAAKALLSEPAMLRMEKAALEQKTADGRLYAAIERKSGLSISDRITAPEESAVGRVLSNLPVVGKAFGALDRGQHMFINDVRRTMFRHGVDQDWSPEHLEQWAKFINNATGRSNLRNIPAAAEVVLTSPRYEASRWAMLGHLAKSPVTAVQALKNPAAREEIKTLGATAASIFLVFKGAEMAGYEVDWNPQSSDFLKMRRGDEVWDISAGIAPRLRDTMRLIGKIESVGDQKERDKVLKTLGGMASRPLSPFVKTPIEARHSYVQRSEGVPEDEIKSFFTGYPLEEHDKGLWAWSPLIYRSFHEALTQDKSVASGLSAAGREFIGTSVQRYPKKEPKQSSSKGLKLNTKNPMGSMKSSLKQTRF